MADQSQWFKIQEGRPVKIGNQVVTPIAKALVIPLSPNSRLVWNRASAVRVATEGAGEVELPVTDVTRRWEIFFVVLALVGIVLGVMFSKRR